MVSREGGVVSGAGDVSHAVLAVLLRTQGSCIHSVRRCAFHWSQWAGLLPVGGDCGVWLLQLACLPADEANSSLSAVYSVYMSVCMLA